MATQNSQSRLKNWPNTKRALEKLPNILRNFAQSGHTARLPRYAKKCSTYLVHAN